MSNKEFINNLSATYADVRRLDAKKINLKGKNILDYIKESTPTIKHSQDTRETVTENDLWGQWIETLEDGTVIVHDDEVVNPNKYTWNTSITKIEDNKAYIGDTLWANIQFEKLKNGDSMFSMCDNLTSFESDLSNLVDGEYMFQSCPGLVTFNIDLSNLKYGEGVFNYCSNLSTFEGDLSSLIKGSVMFSGCENLTSFTSNLSNLLYGDEMFIGTKISSFECDMPKIVNGNAMFDTCEELTSFTSNLSSLLSSSYMFNYCTKLKTFNSDLSNLIQGNGMFYECNSLISFTSNLNNLIDGDEMFYRCKNLTSFTLDLSKLISGNHMFFYGSNLISFTSDLSKLISGIGMFAGCKLTPKSVMYIANSINNIIAEKQLYLDGIIPYYDGISNGFDEAGNYWYVTPGSEVNIGPAGQGKITIGIDIANNSETIEQQLQTFAEEATFNSWVELKQVFEDKGWTVTFQYNGTTTNVTLSEDEQFRGTPIYARLIEVTPKGEEYTEKEKASAEYCTEDGTKYYNIDWGHDVTDYSQYEYFGSLLEACGYYGVIPKKYLEEV